MREAAAKPGMYEIDVVAMASNTYRRATHLLCSDIEALPEEAFTKSFAPKARTAADIIYEMILVNDHVRMVIGDENPAPWSHDGWITAPERMNTKTELTKAFKESCERFSDTVGSLSAAKLCEPLQMEDRVTTRLDRIQFAGVHLLYHSGQLNFIQTLLGDDGWHWS